MFIPGSSASTSITGSCACGSVKFTTDVDPGILVFCYCTTCRKISGAPYLPFVHFRKDRIKWAGVPARFEKSDRATRSHCAKCGTSLTMAYHNDPDEVAIVLGSIDNGLEQIKPVSKCIYVKEAPPWATMPSGVPQVDEM